MEKDKKTTEDAKEFYSKVNINNYHDRDGLTVNKMNLSLLILSYKKPIKILVTSILIAFSVITWFFFFKTYGLYLLKNSQLDSNTIAGMVVNNFPESNILEYISAKDIVVSEQKLLSSGQGKYDFIAKIENKNTKYWSEFEYYIEHSDGKIGPEKGFILPGDQKHILMPGIESEQRLISPKLVFSNFLWEHIDSHKIPNWDEYKNNRINFEITNKKFTPSVTSNLSEKLNLSVVEFDLENHTPYNYYSLDYNVFLYSRGSLISVSKGIIEELLANETRHINITWPGQLAYADRIEVVPEINILDSDILFIE